MGRKLKKFSCVYFDLLALLGITVNIQERKNPKHNPFFELFLDEFYNELVD